MNELLGKTIGAYQLIAELPQTVDTLGYQGFQPALNRYVTIRILKPSLARNLEAVGRFRQTGDFLVQFHHQRLLEVYETGEAEGLIFRAVRFAENGSLRDQLARGPQNPFYETSRLITLFQEIVEGLEHIYAQGYIHGNLTPDTIFIDGMFHPLLSDFGMPGRPGKATSPFMAPEQVQGGVVDSRADIYALGVLLYTLLVGEAPPAGVVVSPRPRRPDVPEGVERVIFKAMAQNPDQRFQSASEFLNALQTALVTPAPAYKPAYTPPPAPPAAPMPTVSQTVTVGGPSKGPNWVAIILGVIIVLICCVGAIFIYRAYIQNQSATPAAPTQPVPPTESGPLPTQPPPIIIMPTQPPAVTHVLPTKEPRPTDAPRPTQPPPEQPTQPPAQPTLPPQEPPLQPTQQPPQQPGQPPVSPEQQPAAGNPLCGSIGLVGAPLIVVGAFNWMKKRRSVKP